MIPTGPLLDEDGKRKNLGLNALVGLWTVSYDTGTTGDQQFSVGRNSPRVHFSPVKIALF
jgi:hypothetical protein